MFLTFSGETVKYEEDETLHPFFINECAYYEKGIAFHLAKKKTLSIPTMQVQKEWKFAENVYESQKVSSGFLIIRWNKKITRIRFLNYY